MLEATRDPQGQFGLHLRGRLVPKGKHQVILTLARSAQASKEQQVWWRRMVFSSENNYEAPDRLFGLETLVDGVCGKLLQQPAPVAQDYVVLNISRAGGAGGGCSIASSENLDQP
jgi:hypothetical protein